MSRNTQCRAFQNRVTQTLGQCRQHQSHQLAMVHQRQVSSRVLDTVQRQQHRWQRQLRFRAGRCTLPATPLKRTARSVEKDSGAGHRAQPGQAAAPSDGVGNSTDTADAANKRQEAQRRGQIFLAATRYTGKGIVIDGVLHLFDVNPPSQCLVDRDVLKQSSKVSPGDGDFMVYVHTPEWNHQIPQLLKVIARDVMPSNKQGTLFKLSHIENWAGLTQGCLVVDKYTAIIRPWVELGQASSLWHSLHPWAQKCG